MIKELYIDYIQKSRIFLYPALDIKRGSSVTPIETFMSWTNYYNVEDSRLICLYHIREDTEFKTFEKVKLLGNPYFESFEFTEDNKGIYVFNLESIADDYSKVVSGNYSKLSGKHKRKIIEFFAQSKKHVEYIESYLYPEKYIDAYAAILASNDFNQIKKSLLEVGELCEKPDFMREDLKLEVLQVDVTE
jgi:hypothetical protein